MRSANSKPQLPPDTIKPRPHVFKIKDKGDLSDVITVMDVLSHSSFTVDDDDDTV